MNNPAPFTVKQREYLMRCMHSWFNVAEGGKRGGKNVLQTMAFCIAVDTHPNRLHLIAGYSTATARLNILDCDGYGLLNYFEGRCRLGQYQNRDCVYIQSATGEKIVLVSGGGKNGDEKLIKGNTYGTAMVTEANECSITFLREVFDRTLSSADRKVYHDLNPKSEGHWYYTDILNFHEEQQHKDPAYGYNYGHFTIADNMSVSDKQLREAIRTYDKGSIWYQRDILGKRKQAEGLVYPMFDRLTNVYPNDKHKGTPYSHLNYISCDYGTLNPFSAGKWKIAANVAYRVKEYYYSGKENRGRLKTDEEYADEVEKLAGDDVIQYVVVDPSAASFITCLRRRGLSVRLANNDVLDGIRYTSRHLKAGRIQIHESCADLIKELGLYMWDSDKTQDTVVKEFDHACDDMRYFALTVLSREWAHLN